MFKTLICGALLGWIPTIPLMLFFPCLRSYSIGIGMIGGALATGYLIRKGWPI